MAWPVMQYQGKQQLQQLPLFRQTNGLNTVLPERFLTPQELVEAQNFKYDDIGLLETRQGLVAQTSATTNDKSIKTIAKVPIGSTTYHLLVDSDNKLYKCTGSPPTLNPGSSVATLEGATTIVPFNSYAILLDGGYIKTYDGTTVRLAYDAGEGSNSYQYNNTCGVDASAAGQDLYTGSKTRAASLVTTASWTSGFTMPVTRIETWISKTGSPTGTLTAKVWDSSTGAVVATSTTTFDPSSEVTTSAIKKEFDFAGTDYLARATAYYFGVEYTSTSSDASNYITIHGSTVASSGKTYYYDGSWHNVATSSLLIGIKPNVPPKGSFGDVKEARLYVAGDPNYPGYVWYSNVNSAFDWSTVNGGGYVSAVDDDANSFAVGGIKAHYGDLYVFGKSTQPYLCKLTGSSPSNYALPPLFQQTYTDHKSLVSILNDIWYVNESSVYAVSGVQTYGDIRAAEVGDEISDKIKSYWSTDAFACFNDKDGQFMLKLSGYANILVGHTRLPFQGRNGKASFRWTEYTLAGLTPTAFAQFDGDFWIGCSNGNLYKLDSSVVQDAGTNLTYSLKTGNLEMPLGTINVRGFYALFASSDIDAKCTLSFYKDGSSTAFLTKTVQIGNLPKQEDLNFNCESLQVKIHTLTNTAKFRIDVLDLLVRKLSRRGR